MKRYCKFLALIVFIGCCLVSCNKDEDLMSDTTPTQQTDTPAQLKRSCGLQGHMDKLVNDDAYQKNHEMKFKRLEKFKNSPQFRALCDTPVRIPMAVHFQGVTNPNASCLRALAQSQVDILNQDYQGRNSDISTWNNTAAPTFPGITNGETCLEFILADQNHPSGFNLSDGDPAVTINQTTGDNNSSWSGYLNIFVQANTGVLGYSPLGGSGNGDGVVIDASAFGSGAGCGNIAPQAPYNLGRTLTHEAGHYLLLDHIWGNGCSVDDEVADTPDQANENYGCPNLGISSCSSNDLHMNYMDYTNDACMYMFSAGQSTRMEGYVGSSLQNLTNNADNVISGGGTTPTCTDGIQNGNETGVDCGGSCEPCEVEPTCTDGIQNGNETGVDCGGSCEPCEVEPTCTDDIQNGDETGVDCGGSCEPCEVEPTCTDGIQNGDETGVDCGGSCEPCEVEPTCTDGIQNGDETGVDCGGSCEPCDETGCEDFRIIVKPDDYGSEIEWVLFDDYGDVIAYGGPYEDFDRTVDRQMVCLEPGCYTFLITDEYGDGICCAYGRGKYLIRDSQGDIVIRSNGRYGYYEIQDFCVGDDGFRVEHIKTDEAKTQELAKDDADSRAIGKEVKKEVKAWLKANNKAKNFNSSIKN